MSRRSFLKSVGLLGGASFTGRRESQSRRAFPRRYRGHRRARPSAAADDASAVVRRLELVFRRRALARLRLSAERRAAGEARRRLQRAPLPHAAADRVLQLHGEGLRRRADARGFRLRLSRRSSRATSASTSPQSSTGRGSRPSSFSRAPPIRFGRRARFPGTASSGHTPSAI